MIHIKIYKKIIFVETKEVESCLNAIGKNLFCWSRGKCFWSISTPSIVVIVAKHYFVSKTVSKIVGVGRSRKLSFC